jgi:hypothetical protein
VDVPVAVEVAVKGGVSVPMAAVAVCEVAVMLTSVVGEGPQAERRRKANMSGIELIFMIFI